MLNINTKEAVAPAVERETLFVLDGTEHTIPRKFLPTDMLRYLHYLGVAGADAAGNWALHYALGDTSFWALIDAGPAVTEDHLRAMIDCVTGRMIGIDAPVPGPKAEPETGHAPETGSTEEPPDQAVWPDEASGPSQE